MGSMSSRRVTERARDQSGAERLPEPVGREEFILVSDGRESVKKAGASVQNLVRQVREKSPSKAELQATAQNVARDVESLKESLELVGEKAPSKAELQAAAQRMAENVRAIKEGLQAGSAAFAAHPPWPSHDEKENDAESKCSATVSSDPSTGHATIKVSKHGRTWTGRHCSGSAAVWSRKLAYVPSGYYSLEGAGSLAGSIEWKRPVLSTYRVEMGLAVGIGRQTSYGSLNEIGSIAIARYIVEDEKVIVDSTDTERAAKRIYVNGGEDYVLYLASSVSVSASGQARVWAEALVDMLEASLTPSANASLNLLS